MPPREMTTKALGLGLFLALVFGAANAYLGMKAGQTVAATIPAAVIAMALFRTRALSGGILEQNIARTAASVGEALVAGAIFVIPAFILVEVDGRPLWTNLREHYAAASMILLTGGLLGVLFTIVLRRAIFSDTALPWPESVASVEIVRAGESKSAAPRLLFSSMIFAGFIQVLKSDKGFLVLREFADGFLAFPRSRVAGVDRAGGISWATPALSPALIGIGYIIGPLLSSISFAGGILAWWILIPLMMFLGVQETPEVLWRGVVRPIAVGAMLMAAANTMWRIRGPLGQSLRSVLRARPAEEAAQEQDRREQDIPSRYIAIGIAGLIVPIILIYHSFTGSWGSSVAAAAVMTASGFLLTAVGAYLVGLVGSSNQPLSGLTLGALILAALLMVTLGVSGPSGIAAVLGVAAVVALAVSVSGSLAQDLKAGHLLGGTPWKMQVAEIIAVVLLSVFLMAPIIALHEANLADGGIGGRSLPAPQAGLMAQLAKGIVGGEMAWGLLVIGLALGLILILTGARAPMLIAVGMYLPFETSAAIFTGGMIKAIADRAVSKQPEEQRAETEERGTLVASGLIAGEAIIGILLAVAFLAGFPSRTFAGYEAFGGWMSLAAFMAIGYALVRVPLRR